MPDSPRVPMPDSSPRLADRQPTDTEIFASVCRPMHPLPTGVAPRLAPLSAVRVVVFDIYGTLLISGSGEVGTADPAAHDQAMQEAAAAVGLRASDARGPLLGISETALRAEIDRQHARARERGVEQPEVDIVDVWRRWLVTQGCAAAAQDAYLPERLAVEFEARANPTWPMPGAQQTLAQLVEQGYRLGIVSNAQQFTLGLMRLHFGGNLRQVGFDNDLSLLSNRFGHAKPGPLLFDRLCQALHGQGYQPDQAVYVGNDMLNDVWAAQRAGLRTALFAGDARSLRWRAADPEVQATQPDVVLTELPQLLACLDGDRM